MKRDSNVVFDAFILNQRFAVSSLVGILLSLKNATTNALKILVLISTSNNGTTLERIYTATLLR